MIRVMLSVFLCGPGAAASALAQLPSVDPMNRASVVSFWDDVYQASAGVDPGWTGDIDLCAPGDLAQAYRDACRLRIQYFRAMTGLPADVSFHPTSNAKCQDAAIMMTANNDIDHMPPSTWDCYTGDGAEAAAKSNLAIGYPSLPDAVTAWVLDEGIPSAGHRRWILYPPQEVMGAGAAFGSGSSSSYVLWVLGDPGGGFGQRPASPEWVAWPPRGFVPYQVVGALWSFSIAGADFGNATVTMTRDGDGVPVNQHAIEKGFGDNTLVWTPTGLPGGPPPVDVTYSITVNNVMVEGAPASFGYEVTVIDPSVMVPVVPTTWGALKRRYGAEN